MKPIEPMNNHQPKYTFPLQIIIPFLEKWLVLFLTIKTFGLAESPSSLSHPLSAEYGPEPEIRIDRSHEDEISSLAF